MKGFFLLQILAHNHVSFAFERVRSFEPQTPFESQNTFPGLFYLTFYLNFFFSFNFLSPIARLTKQTFRTQKAFDLFFRRTFFLVSKAFQMHRMHLADVGRRGIRSLPPTLFMPWFASKRRFLFFWDLQNAEPFSIYTNNATIVPCYVPWFIGQIANLQKIFACFFLSFFEFGFSFCTIRAEWKALEGGTDFLWSSFRVRSAHCEEQQVPSSELAGWESKEFETPANIQTNTFTPIHSN